MTEQFYWVERKILFPILLLPIYLTVAGCALPEEPIEPVVDASETLTFLEAGLRPEELFFPEYLLMEDYQLFQHGWIPQTNLVGAGIRTQQDLVIVRRQFGEVLASNGWKTERMEIGKQSFRLMASLKGETVEIRAVQGTGPTQVFILFRTPNDDSKF